MQQSSDKVSIQLISNVDEIEQISQEWNNFVDRTIKSPFYLSEYVKELIKELPNNYRPIIVVFRDKQAIVGISILKTWSALLGKQVTFIHPYWCSDFYFDERYREECFKQTLDHLFNEMKCKLGYFELPKYLPNLRPLLEQSNSRRLCYRTESIMGHRIISLDSTWAEYLQRKTRTFRRTIYRLERNLTQAGTWKTIRIDNGSEMDVIEKISAIERKSWKHKYWEETHSSDRTLALFLKSAPLLTRKEPAFKWTVWFLTLKEKTIAYQLAYRYKETVYFLKTSYDQQFRDLSPGNFIINMAIRELLDEKQHTEIDLLTDYPYMQSWTKKTAPRIRVTLARGRMPNILQSIAEKPHIAKILQKMYKQRL